MASQANRRTTRVARSMSTSARPGPRFAVHGHRSPPQQFEMAAGHIAPGAALGGDRLQRGRKPDVSGDAVVRRGGIVRTTPAGAGRHAARHHRHGGHARHAEQAEQARVDGDAGVVPAETVADRLHGRAQPAFADAAQHQRRPGPGRVARPLPPARRRYREAGEQQDLRRAAAPGETARRARRVAFGRKRRGGRSRRSRNGLPCSLAGAFQRAVDDRTGPVPEPAVARLAQDLLHEVARRARLGLARLRRRPDIVRQGGAAARGQQQGAGEPGEDACRRRRSARFQSRQHVRFLHSR